MLSTLGAQSTLEQACLLDSRFLLAPKPSPSICRFLCPRQPDCRARPACVGEQMSLQVSMLNGAECGGSIAVSLGPPWGCQDPSSAHSGAVAELLLCATLELTAPTLPGCWTAEKGTGPFTLRDKAKATPKR